MEVQAKQKNNMFANGLFTKKNQHRECNKNEIKNERQQKVSGKQKHAEVRKLVFTKYKILKKTTTKSNT